MKKILIIEDDPVAAHVYRNRLEKDGFQVEIASDGQQGFYRMHELRPDAVLLDLMLPKMNGVEILKKIRAQTQFQHTPILVCTNAYVPETVSQCYQAGATKVHCKSQASPQQIIDALNEALWGGYAPDVPPASAQSQGGGSVAATQGFPGPRPNAVAPNAPPSTSAPTAPRSPSQSPLKSAVASAPEGLAALGNLLRELGTGQQENAGLAPVYELYRQLQAAASPDRRAPAPFGDLDSPDAADAVESMTPAAPSNFAAPSQSAAGFDSESSAPPDLPHHDLSGRGAPQAPVDVNRLLEFAAGDEEALQELVDLYVSQTRDQLGQIQDALSREAPAEIQRLTHACVGASTSCGINQIVPLLRELGERTKAQAWPEAKAVFGQVEQEFERIKEFLAKPLPV